MKKLIILVLAIVVIMAGSCKKSNNDSQDKTLGNGVFILNQGNFNSANATLSYFDPVKNIITNDLFYDVNKIPLGDVAQSITSSGNTSYIVVNNSGLIYAIDNRNARILGSITGLNSPRVMLIIDQNKAYVSDLYSTRITVVNPSTYQIIDSIEVGRTTEGMVMVGSEVFAANWSAFGQTVKNDKVVVINSLNDVVVDTIQVGIEPNSLVVDKYEFVWVLCSGGYDNQEIPSLWKIDPRTHVVVDTLIFDTIALNPDNLNVNNTGDILYYLNKGIYKYSIDSVALDTVPFIEERNDRHFKYLGVDPVSGDIYASDPLDYQTNGIIFRYKDSGVLLSKNTAGIIPGAFGFNYH